MRQYLAITRLGARIEDLEGKHGYVFTTENTGRDYVYRLVSVHGLVSETHSRVHHLRTAREAYKQFDNYEPIKAQ